MATNTYGSYNETFFAQEALPLLENALGLAGRVYREFEKDTKEQGDTTTIRKPSVFTAQSAPSNAQDLNTSKVALVMSEWDEVKFEITDKDRALTSDKIISDHIRPAAYALANKVDQKLATLITRVPWYTQLSGTFDIKDLAKATQVLFQNGVPLDDTSMVHGMVDGNLKTEILAYMAGKNITGSHVETFRRGALSELMGVNWFANQNTPTFTSNTLSDGVGALTANAAINATTIAIGSIDATGTVVKGDTFSIAGLTQRFTVTANATASGGAIAALTFEPALPAAVLSGAVVTFHTLAAAKAANVVFHRNFAALKFAPLPDDMPGVNVSTISDPDLGISVRARIFYEGNNSKMFVALDCLYGYQLLDPNMATRVYAN
jgi:hypothetical protein